jgi:hypothetical protein
VNPFLPSKVEYGRQKKSSKVESIVGGAGLKRKPPISKYVTIPEAGIVMNIEQV